VIVLGYEHVNERYIHGHTCNYNYKIKYELPFYIGSLTMVWSSVV